SSAYYNFSAQAGRSYSIEARDDLDSNNGSPDLAVSYSQNSTCSQALNAVTTGTYTHSYDYRHTSGLDPSVAPHGFRITLPLPAADTYTVKVTNSNTAVGHYLSLSVSETTVYSP